MKLVFDKIGERFFETGVRNGVLFPGAPANNIKGVAWNGLTKSDVSPDGGDANDQYADNIKYLSLRAPENTNGTIEAFTVPEEFYPCMGSKEAASKGGYFAQQKKSPFSYCWISQVGNDVDGVDYSEKLHIIWNATVDPVQKTYDTINENPEAMTLSFAFKTVPMPIAEEGFKPSAHFEIAKTEENKAAYQALIDALYGTDPEAGGNGTGTDSHLLLPDDVIGILKSN